MAKILISALGTGSLKEEHTHKGEYEPAVYKLLGSDREYKTSFVAAALSEYLMVDRIFLIGTSKSMWDEVYNYFSKVSKQQFYESYWVELGEKVASFKAGDIKINENDLENVNKAIDGYLKDIRGTALGGSHCYIIDYGLNEAELWNNFDVIMRMGDNLKEGDEIYLDITHSFRSIPLFNYLMLDLIKILKLNKDFKLSGLFYGMLDIVNELGYAPIVDLSPFYNITLWARGAYNFINYGNGYVLADLINDENISSSIRNISDIVSINHIDEFKREIDRLNDSLKDIESLDPVIKYMRPFLMSFTDRFKGINSSGELQLALAEWYFDNKRFAQGYICLAESFITRILQNYRGKNIKINMSDNTYRKKIKGLIHSQQFKERPEYKDLHKEYRTIQKIRNTIAHAGYADENEYRDHIKEANIHLNKVRKYVFNNKELEKLPELFPFNRL